MSEPRNRILVVEDDVHIARFVASSLEQAGFAVHLADTGRAGVTNAGTRRPDLVIVDLGLPDIDGLTVIKELRAWTGLPIVVLSARSQEPEKVAALDAGADDYLTKPFGVPELLARVRAHLRRRNQSSQSASPLVRFGEVIVDLSLQQVSRNGEAVHLTPVEYRLLAVLARESGRVLTHRQLMREVWGPSHVEDHHYLRIYAARLRQKLERDPTCPEHIVTETAVGYRLAGAA
ncbi:response regulator [Chitinasiproducens palmae]|uniref:Two-component system, OmpR family, KDP operon response regulator KdpE n=1 Tax=Chitinasiproducens palmae TaxID=1770053 RepID=A0A1H2PL41_9BURK|nr:response regulator [Chitinasiproducens palmae]SDV47086.1 two-component system, OmpR family, KDP operon response regulator KdpE [Chitinasiproducens palmae]